MSSTLMEVRNLKKHFPSPAGPVKAVDGINLKIEQGKSFGLVGESGCGKSTLIRVMLKLLEPTEGEIIFQGQDITKYGFREMRSLRKEMGMVFQDPHLALNPKMTVFDIISRPLKIHGLARKKGELMVQVVELMQAMGLQTEHMIRFPHELSGGQKQRIGVARAMAVEPKIIFLDEPTSALDVSVQTKILKLLEQARRERDLTFFYISHDINLIRVVADIMGVMYLGKIVEMGPKALLLKDPHHPYTRGLFAAVPEPDPDIIISEIQLTGEVPSPVNPPPGCNFNPRCPHVMDRCRKEEPEFKELSDGRSVACHLY